MSRGLGPHNQPVRLTGATTRVTSTLRLRVSGILAAFTQRTHSQRAMGVISLHFGLTRLLGMAGDVSALMTLIRGIVAGDEAAVSRSLAASPALASSSLRLQGATRQS